MSQKVRKVQKGRGVRAENKKSTIQNIDLFEIFRLKVPQEPRLEKEAFRIQHSDDKRNLKKWPIGRNNFVNFYAKMNKKNQKGLMVAQESIFTDFYLFLTVLGDFFTPYNLLRP